MQTPSEAPELLIIEADLDTLIRKVGKISIEETRWESRLDAKIAELSRVYCSKEFIQAVYTSIKADAAFCTNLEGGRTPMTLPLMYLYRMLIMYRKPFVRTDSGYHVPTQQEVVAEAKAFFDPTTAARATAGLEEIVLSSG